jgi:trans-aconitate methyltransferase
VLVLVFVNQYELSKVFFFPLNWFAEDPTKWPESVVDVGCGIGGSSRYLARKYGAKCQGITLSPVQAQRANALAAAQGLADKVKCEPSGF